MGTAPRTAASPHVRAALSGVRSAAAALGLVLLAGSTRKRMGASPPPALTPDLVLAGLRLLVHTVVPTCTVSTARAVASVDRLIFDADRVMP